MSRLKQNSIKSCAYCACTDKEKKMKCFPKSKDCKSEYDLEESDFYENGKCDFFRS